VKSFERNIIFWLVWENGVLRVVTNNRSTFSFDIMFHSTTHRLVLLPLTRPRVTCHLLATTTTTSATAAAATATAASALRRTMSSTSSGGKKVAVLGAAGGIGQPLSLLLKLSPHVSELSCYDIVGTPGVAADLSHVRRKYN
jgi:hypothetical protein